MPQTPTFLREVAQKIVEGWVENGATYASTANAIKAGDLPTAADFAYSAREIGLDTPEYRKEITDECLSYAAAHVR